MGLFSKFYKNKEVREALFALDEAKSNINNPDFEIVGSKIREVISSSPSEIKNLFKSGITPKQWAYTAIANLSGDLLESGHFHIYRGVLNPSGPGYNILKLYDSAIDELVRMGIIDSDTASIEKKSLRENMKNIG